MTIHSFLGVKDPAVADKEEILKLLRLSISMLRYCKVAVKRGHVVDTFQKSGGTDPHLLALPA
jgi:hypothetical protein